MNEYIPIGIEKEKQIIDREDGLISGVTFGITKPTDGD